jgi:hypothetical protein
MIKKENLLFILVGVLSILLILEISGVFDRSEKGYSKKEVALMFKVRDLNKKIEELKNKNELIEVENESIIKNISSDSVSIWNGSSEYLDSIRSVYNEK